VGDDQCPAPTQVSLGFSTANVCWVGAVYEDTWQPGGTLSVCKVKVTSAEYVKPVANVKTTWQRPGLGLSRERDLLAGPNR